VTGIAHPGALSGEGCIAGALQRTEDGPHADRCNGGKTQSRNEDSHGRFSPYGVDEEFTAQAMIQAR
jgi:hypothetical protein